MTSDLNVCGMLVHLNAQIQRSTTFTIIQNGSVAKAVGATSSEGNLKFVYELRERHGRDRRTDDA